MCRFPWQESKCGVTRPGCPGEGRLAGSSHVREAGADRYRRRPVPRPRRRRRTDRRRRRRRTTADHLRPGDTRWGGYCRRSLEHLTRWHLISPGATTPRSPEPSQARSFACSARLGGAQNVQIRRSSVLIIRESSADQIGGSARVLESGSRPLCQQCQTASVHCAAMSAATVITLGLLEAAADARPATCQRAHSRSPGPQVIQVRLAAR